MTWTTSGEGPKWLDALNAAEEEYGIPHNLLARVAYEESRFREDIISGVNRSSAGAVGIMQLLPEFFPGAGRDPVLDIHAAAQFLVGLYHRFDDWQVALAAYNWGGGNVHHEYTKDADKYVLADMPLETRNYVSQIIHDVPVAGALVKVQA